MSEHVTFIDRALRGEVFDPDEEIDDAIDAWHESDTSLSLSEWLGLSQDEYALFVEEPQHLGSILKARRYGLDLIEVARARADAPALAARGLDQDELRELIAW
jgi:hypothetical protein